MCVYLSINQLPHLWFKLNIMKVVMLTKRRNDAEVFTVLRPEQQIYLFLDTRGTLQKKVSYSSGVTVIQVKGKIGY
jgi:hypothetical protein